MDPDTVALHARLAAFRRRVDHARDMLAEHISDGWYVSWSGGKDSTVCAALAHQVRPGIPIVRRTRGVDYPEIPSYCADLADREGWDYRVVLVESRESYLADLVDAEPGHGDYLAAATRVLGYEPTGWVYGLRAGESAARSVRLRSTRGAATLRSGHRTCAPLWRWSTLDVHAAHHYLDIPLCPVYARLAALGCPPEEQRVGYLVGGAGGRQGRYHWLRVGWPDEWRRLVVDVPWLAEYR